MDSSPVLALVYLTGKTGDMATQRLMKEGLNTQAIARIAAALARSTDRFPAKDFRREAQRGLDDLELKQRVRHIIAALRQCLPADFPQAAEILARLKPHWDRGNGQDALWSFAAWPLIDYVAVHGLAHPQIALQTLRQLTPLFSAEFALRPFIVQHPGVTLRELQRWCRDPDEHVRRLVSEGTRPRLPWGQRLPQFMIDPAPVLGLLERLKDDASEYVRRSVANNLNDISKDHPDVVLRTCRHWLVGRDPQRLRLVRHATRSLVKAGHPAVFRLLGYSESPKVKVHTWSVNKTRVRVGETVSMHISLKSQAKAEQRLVLDYAVYFVKANGRRAPKVFKLKTLTLGPAAVLNIDKRHSFKEITTRRYYAGEHKIELIINGVACAEVKFHLTV